MEKETMSAYQLIGRLDGVLWSVENKLITAERGMEKLRGYLNMFDKGELHEQDRSRTAVAGQRQAKAMSGR